MSSIEILIETRRIGAVLKVTAVHAGTGTEVVFQAPASASQQQISMLASSKMRYVMSKK